MSVNLITGYDIENTLISKSGKVYPKQNKAALPEAVLVKSSTINGNIHPLNGLL